MAHDLKFDPVSKDLIDSTDGWFEETDTSETAVWLQLESHHDAWWGDPGAGSRLHDLRSFQRDPETLLAIEADRALAVLVEAGLIANVDVLVEPGRPGRYNVATRCRDVSSGQLVDTFVEAA